MAPLRNLGELDAELDTSFAQHFVESDEMRRINNKRSDIIFGAKGVGKTALRRGLTEIHGDRFLGVTSIDFDTISFRQVHKALEDLGETSQLELNRISSSSWLSVLAVYGLEALANGLPNGDGLRDGIESFLRRERVKPKRPNERLLDHIESIFDLVGKIGLKPTGDKGLWLRPEALDRVDQFPLTEKLQELLVRSQKTVSQRGKPALVCLDGFDSIAEHTAEQRRVIFTGLVDAIQKSMKHPLLRHTFCFKAFLPQELTDKSQAVVWDSDKYALKTHRITWRPEELKQLISRRLLPYARTKSKNFRDLWLDSMPDTIRNSFHDLEEDSFDYITRHTQYRPRQVLTHLQRIFDAWEARSPVFKVDASIIPKITKATNLQLSEFVVAQVEKVSPSVGSLLQSLRGGGSVVRASEIRQKIRNFYGVVDIGDVNEVLNSLLGFGIIGYQKAANVEKVPNVREATPHQEFHFSFIGDHFVQNLHAGIDDDDYIALCPMFVEFCGCRPANCGAVVPVEM